MCRTVYFLVTMAHGAWNCPHLRFTVHRKFKLSHFWNQCADAEYKVSLKSVIQYYLVKVLPTWLLYSIYTYLLYIPIYTVYCIVYTYCMYIFSYNFPSDMFFQRNKVMLGIHYVMGQSNEIFINRHLSLTYFQFL